MTVDEYVPLLKQAKEWRAVEGKKIERQYRFDDFKHALAFVNRVGALAEAQQHHPDICIYDWNRVSITLTTHKAGGLSKKDFDMAVKIDAL